MKKDEIDTELEAEDGEDGEEAGWLANSDSGAECGEAGEVECGLATALEVNDERDG